MTQTSKFLTEFRAGIKWLEFEGKYGPHNVTHILEPDGKALLEILLNTFVDHGKTYRRGTLMNVTVDEAMQVGDLLELRDHLQLGIDYIEWLDSTGRWPKHDDKVEPWPYV